MASLWRIQIVCITCALGPLMRGSEVDSFRVLTLGESEECARVHRDGKQRQPSQVFQRDSVCYSLGKGPFRPKGEETGL